MRSTALRKCPRCEAGVIRTILDVATGEETEIGTPSRTTRDDGPAVLVCTRCGEREATYGNDPTKQVPLSAWPLEIDQLLAEERTLLEFDRRTTIAQQTIQPES
jgi:hypothetical protein